MKEGGGLESLTFPEFIVLDDFFEPEPRDNAWFFLGNIYKVSQRWRIFMVLDKNHGQF
jgi:hypothetical protein